MSDIFSPISAFTKDPYTVLINAVPALMTVTVFGNKSKSFITKFDVTPETAMAFEEAIENIFDEKCQAIIFHIFNFKPLGYSHVMKFAYEIRVKLADKKIYNFFYSGQSLFTSGLLISAKIKSTKNDILFVVRVHGDDRLSIAEYVFTDAGYKQIREDMILKANDEPADDLRKKILKGTKPKHIILYGENAELPIMKKLKKNVFTNEKIHRLDKNILKESIVQTLKITKYVRDRSIVKYHVIPKCAKHFAVYFENREEAFFTAKAGEIVPFTKEDYAVRDAVDISVCGFDEITMGKRLIYTYLTDEEDCQKRHRSKIYFHVDAESFPVVRITPLILDLIQELPPKLDDALEMKIPVIVFCDNYSVICAVKKGDDNYSFLDGWNGLYGHDAAMYVDGLHRFHGLEATKMKKENPAHCISNLIEMMSTDDLYEINDPIFKDHGPNEKFDYREQILCFYMLKFLEEHFKVIEDETGEKIEEIAIWPVFEDKSAFKERLLLYYEELEDIKFNFLELDLPE